MTLICIHQQIAELKLELAECRLTKSERRKMRAELDELVERKRLEDEAAYFAAIERDAARFELCDDHRIPF